MRTSTTWLSIPYRYLFTPICGSESKENAIDLVLRLERVQGDKAKRLWLQFEDMAKCKFSRHQYGATHDVQEWP